jgi:hypothetical protein
VVSLPAIVAVTVAISLTTVSDSGSETGAVSRPQVRLDAVSVTARDVQTGVYSAHQVCCSNVRAIRDEEAAGPDPVHLDARSGSDRWLRCRHDGLMLISKEPGKLANGA